MLRLWTPVDILAVAEKLRVLVVMVGRRVVRAAKVAVVVLKVRGLTSGVVRLRAESRAARERIVRADILNWLAGNDGGLNIYYKRGGE